MDEHATQAVKVAASRTLMIAGVGLLTLGAVGLGLGVSDAVDAPSLDETAVRLIVGAILLVFSKLVPRPQDESF